jgi:hypothetical protein
MGDHRAHEALHFDVKCILKRALPLAPVPRLNPPLPAGLFFDDRRILV